MIVNGPYYEVITGDLIASRDLRPEDRAQLPEVLRDGLNMLSEPIAEIEEPRRTVALCYQVFRGDSFQVVFHATGGGLRAAVYLMGYLEDRGHPAFSILARLALGVGTAEYLNYDPTSGPSLVPQGFHGDGEVFELSGGLVDDLKKERRRIGVRTPWAEVNEEFRVHCLALDRLIERWTYQQAQAVLWELRGSKQKDIAARVGVSQPAISRRLRSAGMEIIGAQIERYEQMVCRKINF